MPKETTELLLFPIIPMRIKRIILPYMVIWCSPLFMVNTYYAWVENKTLYQISNPMKNADFREWRENTTLV